MFFKDFVSVKRQKIKRGASQTYDTPPFLRKKGQLIEDADIIIGTTAIINNMVMVTENVKHIGRLNGIVVVNWMEK